jgi:wyosine [tRNA(Phe)-imidazoG37] synthetase (radical SAM superfamily)
MSFIFGPVPSRRLGRSLGIDPVPSKTCNWNCVYCQLGRSRPVVNERREWVPGEEIIAELRAHLESHGDDGFDWITFVGSGETTLHTGIGELIRQTQALASKPVAVITNGSTLHLPEVRQALLPAAAVMPSLDAGSEELYRRITRAHPDCTFERQIEGLRRFREEFDGQMWLEIMLLAGINDGAAELADLCEAVARIKPNEVHLVTPSRAPVEEWVHVPDEEALQRAATILSAVTRVVTPAAEVVDLRGDAQLDETIVAIVTRHPMTEAQLLQVAGATRAQLLPEILRELETSGRIQAVARQGERFYTAATGVYPGA